MPKFKIRINGKEAAKSIRTGMSDEALMKKYALSARGLQSLFRKLVAASEIDQHEIDARMLSCQQSHIVDLIISNPAQFKTALIDADQAVKDIRAGMSDIELMHKYDVSAKGLENLFTKLIAAGQIPARELDERNRRFKGSEFAFDKDSEGAVPFGESLDAPHDYELQRSRQPFLHDHRVFAAALVGAFIGMVLVVVLMILAVGIDNLFYYRNDPLKKAASLQAANEALFLQAQEMISVLEAIARREAVAGSPQKSSVSDYEKCMKDCESSYKTEDALEKAFIINCKKECLSSHSDRFRKIRELYH